MTDDIGNLWFIGLSAAGKTTLGRLAAKLLRERGIPCVSVDGNDIRDLFEKKFGFDPQSRRKQTNRIKNISKWLSSNGVLPIVSIIHPFEDDRVRCREELDGYYEVFLDCEINTCMFRDDKNVYAPAMEGQKKHVIGLDIPFEPPKQYDLMLDSGTNSPEALLEMLWVEIESKLGRFGARSGLT